MHIRICIIVLALAGCGKFATHKPAEPKQTDPTPLLAPEYERRAADYAAKAFTGGWPSLSDCDAAVFAGEACAGGAGVDMAMAVAAPGELHRRPVASGECYPAGSSSSVSRDDLVLYAACQWQRKDLGALEDLMAYADAHQLWMGEPHDPDLTFLGPNLEGIIARAIVRLGGAKRADADLPVVELPGPKDYQQHISVNEILLSSDVVGAATGWEYGLLKALVEANPQDPLFQAAFGVYTGDFTEAIRLLLDPKTPVPTYVRGDQADLFARAWWLRAARIVLDRYPNA